MIPIPKIDIDVVLKTLALDQDTARGSINLVPSENVLSPLARLPFVLDTYSRYFFDHLTKFGAWSFFGGLGAGSIEQEVLKPLLAELAGAPYLNVEPLSGLSCMTVAMGGLTRPGETVVTVPVECGGHISTGGVARRLALQPLTIPMSGTFDVDIEKLGTLLAHEHPALVYIDQSSQLFPIDPLPIRRLIDAHSPGTLLHFDSSHINGLILGGAIANPLDRGADTFGGSTHKTLPGPHKGFLATRRQDVAERLNEMSGIFVSHHQPAAVVSLAITLLEMHHCGGREYARRILANAQVLGRTLYARGVRVAAADRGFTACHQVWVDPGEDDDAVELSTRLVEAGLVVNRVDVPGISGPALRLSVAEMTRLGAEEPDTEVLANLLADAIVDHSPADKLWPQVVRLRQRLNQPRFCFGPDDLGDDVPPLLADLIAAIQACVTAPEDRKP